MRTVLIVSTLCALASLALPWMMWDALPDELPVHWGPTGEPDRWQSKSTAIWFGVGLSFVLPMFCYGVTRLDPRKDHTKRNDPAIILVCSLLAVFGLGMQVLTVTASLSETQQLPFGFFMLLLGLLYAGLGLALGKARSNYFFGVRTPWTLESEAVWHRTHRVAGWTLVLSGLVVALLGLVGPNMVSAIVAVIALGVGPLFPVVYSWVIYRKEAQASDAQP